MKANKNTSGYGFYWLAFLLALGLRLYQLGAAALSDVEASWALQALGLGRGEGVILGGQPAYLLLTSQLFSIIKDTNFLARLFPALAGSLLVWLPYAFKDWLGKAKWMQRVGVLMAFGLAIDPGLVSLSRLIGSPMPALAFTLLFVASLHHRRMIWAGILAGFALLSGQAFLQGALILGVSWGVYRLTSGKLTLPQAEEDEHVSAAGAFSGKSIGVALAALAVTLLSAGTLFLRAPQGLGGLAETISAYLATWVTSSGIPVFRLPAALLIYQPLVLIFAIYGIIRAWFGGWDDPLAQRRVRGLSIWAAVGIILPLLYAGRQVGDVAWALIPLWALASIEISRVILVVEDRTTRLVAACLALLLFVLAVVGWINLLAIGRYQTNVVFYWAIIFGALLLGLIAALLVLAGWSSSAAKMGVTWAVCIVFGLQLISNTWGTAVIRQNTVMDLWMPPPATGQADLLLTTLANLSSWSTGLGDQMEIVGLVDSPALKWALRDYHQAHFQTALSSSESPPVVITMKDTEEPQLAEMYRGQDFVWRLYPGWAGIFPSNFIDWLAFRQAPLGQDQIILWARADIFPGGGTNETGNALP